jgi:hypothetical protein
MFRPHLGRNYVKCPFSTRKGLSKRSLVSPYYFLTCRNSGEYFGFLLPPGLEEEDRSKYYFATIVFSVAKLFSRIGSYVTLDT